MPWRTCAAFTLLPSYHPSQARRGALEDVCAWLVINSMRTERVQFEVWALHCARNAWRKKAMARLCETHAAFGEGGHRPLLSAESLDLFREEVDHDVSNSVPVPVDSAISIRTAAAAHAALLPSPADSSAIEIVLGLLAGREQTALTKPGQVWSPLAVALTLALAVALAVALAIALSQALALALSPNPWPQS